MTQCELNVHAVPLFLLFFAFLWGIEKPNWRLGLVVLIISVGLVMLVRGETHFDMAGFTLVMVASCCSGLRFTLTQVFLHGHHESSECSVLRDGQWGVRNFCLFSIQIEMPSQPFISFCGT